MTALLEISGLTVRYGGLRAVDNVDVAVEEGSFAGLIGPNGAGKTTLIDAVTGFTPSTGHIEFAGERIDGYSAHRRGRGGLVRTFQSLELFEDLTVRENLLVSAERARWWSSVTNGFVARPNFDDLERVDSALETLGLADRAESSPRDLSLGLRKLVTVARALAMSPRLLLLDEPAAGLDSQESAQLGQTLRRVRDTGITLLLVDHDMGLVLSVCEDIHVLESGRIIAHGSPAELRQDAAVINAYLGTRSARADAAGNAS